MSSGVVGLGAEADREVALERRQDPEELGRVGDLLWADDRRELREDRVVRRGERLVEVDRAERLAFVVVHDPELAAGVDRHLLLRGELAQRRDAFLERGRVDERLERGSRLALTLRREVELVLVVIRAADHREYRAGVVLRVDRHERDRRVDAVRRQHRRDRLARDVLQVHVERRLDLEPVVEDLARRGRALELVLHVVREVRRLRALGRAERDVTRIRHGVDQRVHELAVREVPLRVELAQHQVAARPARASDARPGPTGSDPRGCPRGGQPRRASSSLALWWK